MNSNNFSILFIFIGLISYILVDQGVFQFKSFQSTRIFENESFLQEKNNSFEILSNSTRENLDKFSDELKVGKGRLKVIQVAADQIENDLLDKRKQLKEIDQKIVQMKTILETERKRKVASVNKNEASVISSFTKSLQNLESDIEVGLAQLGGKSAVRIKTKMTFQSEDSAFLTPNGIKKVKAILKSITDSEFGTFYFAFQNQSLLTRDRIRSVRKFVQDHSSNRIEAKPIHIKDPNIQLVDDFEIWIALEELG